ncbi:DNA excision repair protein ERCC-2 [Nematocida displodere]|uniref:DNA 5'-3' helicase n=1 Tax=Nematocida displodere TaxID=1805483 RepID=A0A177EEU3_9MICR|nr:DNA excision repair protein ERCC-2 [Nematocida displodere]
MIIRLGEVEVFFPLEKIYPEQVQYIKELFEVVQGKGHCLLEMPTGTGKTIALLSFLVSYQVHLMTQGVGSEQIKKEGMKRTQNVFRLVYCTRTTAELEKVLAELKGLYAYIKEYIPDLEYTGIGMAARRTLCLNEEVLKEKETKLINKACKHLKNNCQYFKGYVEDQTLPPGIYTLDELKAHCQSTVKCPYYLARALMPLSDCIVYTYNYMIDPKINELVSSGLGSNCVVVFDEAHNIDSACIEALSVEVSRGCLDKAWKSVSLIAEKISSLDLKPLVFSERKDGIRTDFYAIAESHSSGRRSTVNMPGSLRAAKGFVSAAQRVVEFFKTKLKTMQLTAETTESFIRALEGSVFVDFSSLVHLSRRLRSLISELERNGHSDDYEELARVCDFCSLAAQFKKGFSIIFEPFDAFSAYDPVLRLSCLDASIAMKRVFSTYKNVIITSGTLSPISIYPRLLDFAPVKSVEIDVSSRRGLCALIVTKGSDQMTLAMAASNAVSSTFSLRSEPAVVRNYGNLLLEISAVVPDGLVCFFSSYRYMEEAVSAWVESGMIRKISENKLIFAESLDHQETERALDGYRKACEIGRGAILLSVARGKVSEGVDFTGCYGRGVIVLGVPFQYTESPRLKKRLEFLASEFGIRESEFLSFDAMRQAAQCVGRVLRSNTDYGLAILADRRFNTTEKKAQLPRWIQRHVTETNSNLSIDMAVALSRQFLRRIPTTQYYN